MKMYRKQWLGTVASAAIALTAISGGLSYAKGKSDTIKPNPPTATDIETGQLLIKDRPTARAGGQPDPTPPANAADWETGQLLIKDKPKPSVARNKSGWIVPTLGAVAVIGGVLAASGGKSKPASP